MGYDHNTDTMYWFAHSQVPQGAAYVNINVTYTVTLETAACTEVGSYGPGGQTCLFIPNSIESDLFQMGINATGFSLEPYSTTMVQNQTRQIKVAWQPWNAQANGVMWSTSNENIAVVDANGLVTAVSEGDAVITATGQVWDPYHWDNETGTTVPAWVDYSSEC